MLMEQKKNLRKITLRLHQIQFPKFIFLGQSNTMIFVEQEYCGAGTQGPRVFPTTESPEALVELPPAPALFCQRDEYLLPCYQFRERSSAGSYHSRSTDLSSLFLTSHTLASNPFQALMFSQYMATNFAERCSMSLDLSSHVIATSTSPHDSHVNFGIKKPHPFRWGLTRLTPE
jgi:hypothetical protein